MSSDDELRAAGSVFWRSMCPDITDAEIMALGGLWDEWVGAGKATFRELTLAAYRAGVTQGYGIAAGEWGADETGHPLSEIEQVAARTVRASWEQALRLTQRGGAGPEVVWRDPVTPTIASRVSDVSVFWSDDQVAELLREVRWDMVRRVDGVTLATWTTSDDSEPPVAWTRGVMSEHGVDRSGVYLRQVSMHAEPAGAVQVVTASDVRPGVVVSTCDRPECPNPGHLNHWHCGRCQSPEITSMLGHTGECPS